MLYYGLEQHSLDSYFQFKELGSAPSTPTSNEVRLYAKDDGSGVSTLCYKNDAGTEICFPSSGTIVTGTGVSGRLAFWNGTSTLTSDSDLTFSVDTLTATKIIAPTSVTISTLTSGSVVFAGASGLLSQNNAQFFWDNSNIRLGIGGTPNFDLDVQSVSGVTSLLRSSADATPPNANLRKSRGTIAVPVKVNSADKLGNLVFQGHDGSAFATGTFIQALTAENWGTTAHGTSLLFNTTPTGSITTAEVFRIGPSGQWGIGGATFGTALDVFTSGGASAAPTWTSPGALTKVDDTNVTLTLGGTPATALLRAASLTLGWTGTLAVSRGGTGQSTVAGYNALLDHGTLLGLADDDHTQYALLAGRSGGQIAKGGTAAADGLTLTATAGVGVGSEFVKIMGGNNGATQIAKFTTSTSDPAIRFDATSETWFVRDVTNLNPGFIAGAMRFKMTSSNGTPTNGFGSAFAFNLEDDSNNDVSNVAFIGPFWEDIRAAHQVASFSIYVKPDASTAVERFRVTGNGNILLGSLTALATTATDGFVYIPTSAGAPTGTPTAYTGKVAMQYDTTNNKLYIYNGGWKTTTVFA